MSKPRTRRVKGNPYSAVFYQQPSGGDGYTDAYGIVTPPFVLTEELIGLVTVPGTEVKLQTSTATKTVLELALGPNPAREDGDNHKTRTDRLYSALASIVERLNDIENGTGPFAAA